MRSHRVVAAAAVALATLLPALPAGAAGAPPGTPGSPAAVSATDGIEFSWSAPTTGAAVDHYAVLRSDAPTAARSVPATGTHFADRLTSAGGTAQPGATYGYQVEAVAADGTTSPATGTVTATAPPAVYDGGAAQVLAVDSPTDTRIRPRSSTTYTAPGDAVALSGSHRALQVAGVRSSGRARIADTLVLRAPAGAALAPGSYAVVSPQAPDAANQWVLDLTGRLYACPSASGRVSLTDVRFDSDGVPSVADLDATLSCAPGTDPVRLGVRIHTRRTLTAEELDVPDPTDGVAVGAPATVPVTVRNTGSNPLTIGAGTLAAAGGTPASEWSLDDSACRTQPLAPGASCTERLQVRPAAGGLRSVLLRLNDSSDAGAHERVVSVHAVTAPPAPENLAVTHDGQTLRLTWERTDSFASTASSFVVYRGSSTASLAPVTTLAASAGDEWTDEHPPGGRAVVYAVEAVNAAGRARSAPLELTLGRHAPSNLVVQPLARSIGVAWSAPPSLDAQPVGGYLVYAGKTPKKLALVGRTPLTGARLTVPPKQRIYVAVAAVYAGRPGPRTKPSSGLAGVAELDTVQVDGDLAAVPLRGGRTVPIAPDAGGGGQILTGRNGTTLVVSGVAGADGGGQIWSTELGGGGSYAQIGTPEGRDADDATLSPDGSLVVYTASPGRSSSTALHRVSTDGDGDIELPGTEGLSQPSWVPFGSQLVAADGQGLVLVDGREHRRVTSDAGHSPSVSPNGRAVAYLVDTTDGSASVTGQELRLVATGGGGTSVLLPGNGLLGTPRWDPTGRYLVLVRRHLDGTPGELLRLDLRSHRVVALRTDGDATAATWSQPDVAAPTVRITRVPVSAVRPPGAKAATLRASVTWSAADDVSGVRFVSLRVRSAPLGRPLPARFSTRPAWNRITTSPVLDSPRRRWRTCYSMLAVDWAGHRSAWTREVCVAPR